MSHDFSKRLDDLEDEADDELSAADRWRAFVESHTDDEVSDASRWRAFVENHTDDEGEAE